MGSVFIFCKYQKINVLKVYDIMASYAPIFIFNVRIANFINQELPGTITDMPWGVVFPRFDSFIRHPSQIYEAIGEGFLLYIIIAIYAKKYQKHDGMRCVVFLIGYAIIRFMIEFVRMPDQHLGYVFLGMTMGQVLCLGMMLAAYLIYLQIHRVNSIEKKFL